MEHVLIKLSLFLSRSRSLSPSNVSAYVIEVKVVVRESVEVVVAGPGGAQGQREVMFIKSLELCCCLLLQDLLQSCSREGVCVCLLLQYL